MIAEHLKDATPVATGGLLTLFSFFSSASLLEILLQLAALASFLFGLYSSWCRHQRAREIARREDQEWESRRGEGDK